MLVKKFIMFTLKYNINESTSIMIAIAMVVLLCSSLITILYNNNKIFGISFQSPYYIHRTFVNTISNTDESMMRFFDVPVGGHNFAKAPTIKTTQVNESKSKSISLMSTIKVGSEPRAIYVDPKNNVVYVANSLSNTVSIIDGKTANLIKTLKIGVSPSGIAGNTNTNMIYVTNQDSNTVSVINGSTNAIESTISTNGDSP